MIEGISTRFSHRSPGLRESSERFDLLPSLRQNVKTQAGNASARSATDVDMNVVAGEVPFRYVVMGLEQSSSEPAGFNFRVSAGNGAGYGRPSAVLNIKVCLLDDASPQAFGVTECSTVRSVPVSPDEVIDGYVACVMPAVVHDVQVTLFIMGKFERQAELRKYVRAEVFPCALAASFIVKDPTFNKCHSWC